MKLGDIDPAIIITVAFMVLGYIVQFVVLKTDMKWIKKVLGDGKATFKDHETRLRKSEQRVASISTICKTQHGVQFNDKGD